MLPKEHIAESPDLQLYLAYAMQSKGRVWDRIIILILSGITIMLLLVSVVLFLRQTTEVKFVEVTKMGKDFVYNVVSEPLNQTEAAALSIYFLKNYVMDRHRINGVDDRERAEKILSMSSEEVVKQYKREYQLQQEKLMGVQRSVEIVSDMALSPHLHRITFKTKDQKDGETAEKQWVVIVEHYRLPEKIRKKMTIEEVRMNPYGLYVKKYSWGEGVEEGNDHAK